MNWREIPEAKYRDMHLPPCGMIVAIGPSIIVVSPKGRRICTVTGKSAHVYDAFTAHKSKWWESIEPLTISEFKAFTPDW